MTLILEYRDKIKKFYRMNSVVILPILKFLLAFIALNGVNTMMGYMPKLDALAIVLVASLACSFLPAGCLILLCTLFSLGHMYALSLEVLGVGLCIYLLIFLLLLRFSPGDSYVIILTPLFFAMKIPYVIPIAVGLLGTPLSAISVACGVIVYHVLRIIVGCAPTISTMGEKEVTEKIRFLLESLLNNKAMLVIAASFAVTVLAVYLIRRMSVEHAWTIAMVAGAMVNLVILLVGDLRYDINLSMGSAILGSVLAVLVAKVIEFFRFCVDYGRTEWVQFEDDEYYYYVKAVPKMSVAAPTKTVKRINANTQSIPPIGDAAVRQTEGRRTQPQGRAAAQTRTASQTAAQGRERVRETARSARTSVPEEYQEYQEEQGQTRAIPQVRNFVQGRAAQQDDALGPNRPTQREGAPRQGRPVQREGVPRQSRASVQPGSASVRSQAGMTSGGGTYGGTARTVTTERTPRTDGKGGYRQGSVSATVGSNRMTDTSDASDDYEELF